MIQPDISVIGFSEPEINRRMILSFLNCNDTGNAGMSEMIDSAVSMSNGCFTYSAVYSYFDISLEGDVIDLGFTAVRSHDLAKNLSGCDRIVLFAATVGYGIDRLISRYKVLSPSKAACLQALGGERIESLCDAFNKYISDTEYANGYMTHPRFSCGYGDLPLSLQKDILSSLDAYRKLGISLTQGMLMMPSKSVTAIIGLEKIK